MRRRVYRSAGVSPAVVLASCPHGLGMELGIVPIPACRRKNRDIITPPPRISNSCSRCNPLHALTVRTSALILALLALPCLTPAQRRIVPLARPPRAAAIVNQSGAHLNYYGGRGISNVHVAVVFWTANVDPTTPSQTVGFYNINSNSRCLDLL